MKDQIEIVHISDLEMSRTYQLMEQYQDTPMDLAGASLVALAESRNLRRIFTLDSDFFVYRIHGRDSFEVLPQIDF